ncbi:conserved hypothetical protein [Culex quinquefasciatus]|uniref:Uncharacterized protein n=1 Tax=Culex quinquefasciatus TaxID=7176 RepID=B0WSE1_CULQU|nr:conserved hypothetical protein [Culex quinquefasciatus]|eukprot:XP_001870669.1 conserved hypothetical protein [Culex quinquefasciatus]
MADAPAEPLPHPGRNVPRRILKSRTCSARGASSSGPAHFEGQSVANTARVDPRRSHFGTPLDLHLACRGSTCLNLFDNFWPVGYGFAFLPTQPGLHRIRVATWKVSSANSKCIPDRFPAQNLPCHFP